MVRLPALAPQQLVEAAVAEPAALAGERPEALAQPFMMPNPLRLAARDRARDPEQPAGAAARQPVLLLAALLLIATRG